MIKQNPKQKVWPKGTTYRDQLLEYGRMKRELPPMPPHEYDEKIREIVEYLGI